MKVWRPSHTLADLREQERWFDDLPDLERALVEILGVWSGFLPLGILAGVLSACGARKAQGLPLTAGDILGPLQRMARAGALEEDPRRGFRCELLPGEVACRRAVRSGRFPVLVRATQSINPWSTPSAQGREGLLESQLRSFRRSLYLGDPFTLRDSNLPIRIGVWTEPHDLPPVRAFLDPFDPVWFVTLSPDIQGVAFDLFYDLAIRRSFPADELVDFFIGAAQDQPTPAHLSRFGAMAEYRLLQGRLHEARLLAQRGTDEHTLFVRAMLLLFEGKTTPALALFRETLQVVRKATRRRIIFPAGLTGPFFLLTLLKENSRPAREEALELCRQTQQKELTRFPELVAVVEEFLRCEREGPSVWSRASTISGEGFPAFFRMLLRFWAEGAAGVGRASLEVLVKKAILAGFLWVAEEMAALLERAGLAGNELYRLFPGGRPAAGRLPLAALLEARESWEMTLTALANLAAADDDEEPGKVPGRVAWEIVGLRDEDVGYLQLHAKEQRPKKSGGMTAGRVIRDIKAWQTDAWPGYVTPADQQALTILFEAQRSGTSHREATLKALEALTGHPHVYDASHPGQRIEILRGQPQVFVRARGENIEMELVPDLKTWERHLLRWEPPARIILFSFTSRHEKLAALLRGKVAFPGHSRDPLLRTVSALSRLVTVHSDIGGGEMTASETVPADTRLRVQLAPDGPGLKASVLVRPLGEAGPTFQVGRGGQEVFAEADGRRLHASRDLGAEARALQELVERCPSLASVTEGDYQVPLPDPQEALELLLQLEPLQNEVVVEWPAGKPMFRVLSRDFSALGLTAREERDWFAVEGRLELDEGQVLSLRELLDLVDNHPGRFIPLDGDRWLALTENLRKRLDDLAGVSEIHGQGVKVHPLAAPSLADAFGEENLTGDDAWRKRVEAFRSVADRRYTVPSTLTAELRDYQEAGFQWLCRLADWGAGACLADDMGLGKTIQALALILARSGDGPTLVVAPTSVCLNWIDETRRFAPTLQPRMFGPGDRRSTLEGLAPHDLLVCSYGLLNQESGLFENVPWQTIVLDEAQAIKNMATQRSQAVMSLQGKFRLIMTGTPIENHLGEIWNLFRFINPGLLGSFDRFNRVFAVPIQRSGDKSAQNRLKRLLQPFVLRRTKSQVLQELPPRTEITLHVESSPGETAMYEALRRRAMEALVDAAKQPEKAHFRILAEIMKLRRFCCHPRLVLPGTDLSGAKLELLEGLFEELRENRHKALVFSQFTDHLAIVREMLDRKKVFYQYLDGGTPPAKRRKAVDAFQAGEGDLFLISLKAGGLGLNLTAADYVIHLDPWWNPAVEDQASDRAHRIGQLRPVTVYRLVTRNTIEEKIVALHRRKRDLADGLLEGADLSDRISAEDLLALLAEGRDED